MDALVGGIGVLFLVAGLTGERAAHPRWSPDPMGLDRRGSCDGRSIDTADSERRRGPGGSTDRV